MWDPLYPWISYNINTKYIKFLSNIWYARRNPLSTLKCLFIIYKSASRFWPKMGSFRNKAFISLKCVNKSVTYTWWQHLVTGLPIISKQFHFKWIIFSVHIWTCLVTVHNSLRLILIGWFNWIMARLRHLFGLLDNSYHNNEWKRNSWKLHFINKIAIRNTWQDSTEVGYVEMNKSRKIWDIPPIYHSCNTWEYFWSRDKEVNVSLIEFMSKIRRWSEMSSLGNRFNEKIQQLERNFSVVTVVFKK